MKEDASREYKDKEKSGMSILNFSMPVIYLSSWILLLALARFLLGDVIVGNTVFIISSLAILFIGIIAKSTSWSIGHEKFGIKGDSTSKKIEFCADGVGTIKIFDDNSNDKIKLMEAAGKTIKELKK